MNGRTWDVDGRDLDRGSGRGRRGRQDRPRKGLPAAPDKTVLSCHLQEPIYSPLAPGDALIWTSMAPSPGRVKVHFPKLARTPTLYNIPANLFMQGKCLGPRLGTDMIICYNKIATVQRSGPKAHAFANEQ